MTNIKYIFSFSLLLISLLSFSQAEYIVNTQLLNVRSGAGTKYDVVGQVKLNEKVEEVSKLGKWSEIRTKGFQGFVSSKYISKINDKSKKKDTNNIVSLLIALGLIGYVLIKIKKFISGIFSGISSSTIKKTYIPPLKTKHSSSGNSAVYRFRVKGSGSSGGVKYVDGMNVEVAVTGLGANGSPFNNIVEKKFVEEFARKYHIDTRFNFGISMLFKSNRLDVEIL